MKYGTEQRARRLRGFMTSSNTFPWTEKQWTANMASKDIVETFVSQPNECCSLQFCRASWVSPRSATSSNNNKKKCCNLLTSFWDLPLTSPLVTDMQRTEMQNEVKKKYILKAQTVAATLMQPCLARNTLLYHLIYKYTAFFFYL